MSGLGRPAGPRSGHGSPLATLTPHAHALPAVVHCKVHRLCVRETTHRRPNQDQVAGGALVMGVWRGRSGRVFFEREVDTWLRIVLVLACVIRPFQRRFRCMQQMRLRDAPCTYIVRFPRVQRRRQRPEQRDQTDQPAPEPTTRRGPRGLPANGEAGSGAVRKHSQSIPRVCPHAKATNGKDDRRLPARVTLHWARCPTALGVHES
jgi:hypothetical protein